MGWVLSQIAAISEIVDSQAQISNSLKKINFWGHELETQISASSNSHERLQILSSFFFMKLGFKVSPEGTSQTALFHHVIQSRSGMALTISIFYSELAERARLKVKLLNIPGHTILKCVGEDQSYFVDISRNGMIMKGNELLQSLQEKYSMTLKNQKDFLELLKEEDLVDLYLKKISSYFHNQKVDQALKLIEFWIHIRPKDVSLLGKRAYCHFTTGDYGLALKDLKRYFSFLQDKDRPKDLVEIFDKIESSHI